MTSTMAQAVTQAMTRVAVYARYSSDAQRAASIEDQVRLCRRKAEQEGWTVLHLHGDRAVSGTSLLRPGYQAVMEHARLGEIDVVLAESLDRLSRDQEETAALFKQLRFLRVELVTVAEGQITELHVGLKGTMNALYLKDLAQKTHRGLEGRVRDGRSGGGISFGYELIDERDARGEPIRGGRRINEAEAAIVRRIYREFASGQSPRAIAQQLNKQGVPGPAGGPWGPSTIYGNWRRGTGILNNELYVGRMVWNRLRYVKDPSTGKRVSQLNPPEAWVQAEVQELRIIDDALWEAVKARQRETRHTIASNRGIRAERARRPAYLLSGLLKCGVCGGGFSKISRTSYGCSRARNQGTCDNLATINREALEARVLDGLRHHLMQPEAVRLFVAEYNAELARLWRERHGRRDAHEAELGRVQKDIDRTVDAILAGIRSEEIRHRLATLEARKAELVAALTEPAEPMAALHPGIAEVYAAKVADLATALNDPLIQSSASEAIRALIDEVCLVPEEGSLAIELKGDLAALLTLATEDSRTGKAQRHEAYGRGVRTSEHPRPIGSGVPTTLVAGAGFGEGPTLEVTV